MLAKSHLPALLVACILMVPMAAWAATVDTTVTINGSVATFAEWDSTTQTVNIAAITAVNQSKVGTGTFQLYMNGDVDVSAAGGTNSGVLKDNATSTYSLTTEYHLQGDLDVPDLAGTWLAAGAGAGEFFEAGHKYHITHDAGTGSYAVTLEVRVTSPAAAAPEAGAYSCTVVLTATY